jgi:membrane protease YdiL (CAAX protease family)
MTRVKAFIQEHPALAYFVLVFALVGTVWIPLTGGSPLSRDALSDPRFMVAILLGGITPAAACLLLTGVLSGRAGYRELGARLSRWRMSGQWYAAALLPAPLVAMATGVLLALALGSSDFLPAAFTSDDLLGLLLPGIMTGLFVGFVEELGWTGFAIPRLRRRYGVVATGLLVGALWGAWHFPLFWERDSFSDGLSLILLLVALFSWLPAYRILMVWVYDGTQSLLVAVLMHASLSATQVILLPSDLSDTQALTSMLVRSCVWWVIVAAVAVARRGDARPAVPAQTTLEIVVG